MLCYIFCYQTPIFKINPRIQAMKELKERKERQPSKKKTNLFGGSNL